jgi:hypothetical protein
LTKNFDLQKREIDRRYKQSIILDQQRHNIILNKLPISRESPTRMSPTGYQSISSIKIKDEGMENLYNEEDLAELE